MNWHRYVICFCLSGSITGFIMGVWKYDVARLSLAFVFLSLAWMYREMYLGWNEETKTWKFVKRKQAQP